MKLASSSLSDVGRQRQHNEDACLADDDLGLYVVCDGMGGHAAGDVAAGRAVEAIRAEVASHRRELSALAADPGPANRLAVADLLETAIQRASAVVYGLAQADPSRRGMGTTCVALVIAGGKGVIGHVGDSRVYLLRAGLLHRLTEDHTLVQAQLKQGLISAEQAAVSEYKNVITRAVGIQPSVQVDTLVTDVLPGDLFLLCTDGLHGYLEDGETAALLAATPAAGLPARLVALANERGGRDNVTAVAVTVSGAPVPEVLGEVEARFEAMRAIPLFRHLGYKEQLAVLSLAVTRSYGPGAEIAVEEGPAEELFVVVRGRVAVEKGGVPIAELLPGGHFGELGLVDNGPRPATVRALEPTRCVVLCRNDLLSLMRREPVLAVKLLWSLVQVLSERLRAVNLDACPVPAAPVPWPFDGEGPAS